MFNFLLWFCPVLEFWLALVLFFVSSYFVCYLFFWRKNCFVEYISKIVFGNQSYHRCGIVFIFWKKQFSWIRKHRIAILYGVGLSDAMRETLVICTCWDWPRLWKKGSHWLVWLDLGLTLLGSVIPFLWGLEGCVLAFNLGIWLLTLDSIETVMAAHWFDGNISIPGCDKNIIYAFQNFLQWVFVIVAKL